MANQITVTGNTGSCQKSSATPIQTTSYENDIGTYQNGTLAAIDAVLAQLNAAGMKAIISPHDANDLPPAGTSTGYNGIDIYGEEYGSSDGFYNSATAQKQYDARLASIMNYVSPAFGKRWAVSTL